MVTSPRKRAPKAAATDAGAADAVGLPMFGDPNPNAQQVDLSGVLSVDDKPAGKKPRGARRSSKTAAERNAQLMTADGAYGLVGAVFMVYGGLVAKNPGWMLTEADKEIHAALWAELARQVNALPEWAQRAVTVGGGGGFVAVALFELGRQKKAEADRFARLSPDEQMATLTGRLIG